MKPEPDHGGALADDLARLGDANTATDADPLPDVLIHSEGEPALSLRPCYWVFDQWADKLATEGGAPAQRRRPGVWFFGIKAGRGEAPPAPVESFVCGPLTVEAVTTDSHGANFGRLLRLCNTLGHWVQWAMPMEMLAGTGDTLRAELLAMGLEIDIRGGRDHLPRYLTWQVPRRRVLCVQSTGWAGPGFDAFVLPARVMGPGAAGVVYQVGQRDGAEYAQAGTLEGWRAGVAARAVGNPILTLALCAGFAGPLLAPCHAEGGGLHLVGDSSTGKTTAVEVAASVWGGPGFRRSWHTTANGLEGAAQLFNDSLLVLDEISECDPKDVGAIVYALGNGAGKQRAGRTGAARSVARWRCLVLSSGERTISTTMAQAGQRQQAGQAVRMLDVPCTRQHGAWDELHGLASGVALSDALKRQTQMHHGHAGLAFLEALTRQTDNLGEALEAFKALPEFACASDTSGQVRRGAGRFALLALAGELATQYGVTGWPEGEAVRTCGVAFALWRDASQNQGRGTLEAHQVTRALLDFVNRHGDSRFSDADDPADPTRAALVRDRAGWWRNEGEGRRYLFTTEGMREALKGFDFKRAMNELEAAGAVPAIGKDGKRSRAVSLNGRRLRVYVVNPDALSDGAE